MLRSGSKLLCDNELLAIIVGKETKNNDDRSRSKKIVKKIDEAGLEIQAKDIRVIDGIDKAKVKAITDSLEFVRREIKQEGLKITLPAETLSLMQHYVDRKQEIFLVVSINGTNEVLNLIRTY